MHDTDMEQTLTGEELARRLKISVEQVARLRRRGELPARIVGGTFRFLPSEVLEALPRTVPALARRFLGAPDVSLDG